MANKAEQKNQARLKREAAQAAAAAQAKRNRLLGIGGGVIGVAIVAVLLVVIISGGDSSKKIGKSAATGGAVQGVAATKDLLAGIPQNGYTLGQPKAPITILEFLDVQCPYCKAHELDEQPTVIKNLVRTGKADLKMQPVAILGQDSVDGRVVLTRLAGENKAWNFANLFYWNQATERTGYVTDAYLTKLVAAAGGKPTDISRTPDAAISKTIAGVDSLAQTLGVTGTPTFAIGLTGKPETGYKVVTLDPNQGNAQSIDAAVAALEKSSGIKS